MRKSLHVFSNENGAIFLLSFQKCQNKVSLILVEGVGEGLKWVGRSTANKLFYGWPNTECK